MSAIKRMFDELKERCCKCGEYSDFGGYRPGVGWLCTPCLEKAFVIKNPSKCECGSEKCGSNKHSTWCPKYKKEEENEASR